MPASLRSLPFAHKVTLGIAVAVLGMAGFLFINWISTPTYSLLYAGLDDAALADVISGLDRSGVSYRLESGGSRVLVPQNDVYRVRAELARAPLAFVEYAELRDPTSLEPAPTRLEGPTLLALAVHFPAAAGGDGARVRLIDNRVLHPHPHPEDPS